VPGGTSGFEDVPPVRGFRWNKGDRSFPGWYYAVTTCRHVGYEAWLERDRLNLLDFAPDVVGIASQPFWLHWRDGEERRRHAPDYFVRLADGRARVVDVRAEDQVDERTVEAFAATERACSAAGWDFVHVGVPDQVLMANVRWLARYRHRRCGREPDIAEHLLEVFRQPRQLRAGAEKAGDVLRALPVLFHLLWAGALRADLGGALLGSGTVVHTSDERAGGLTQESRGHGSVLHSVACGPPNWTGKPRLDRLAVLAGRPAGHLERALVDSSVPRRRTTVADRYEMLPKDTYLLYRTIRQDAESGLPPRRLAERHGVSRNVVRRALTASLPPAGQRPNPYRKTPVIASVRHQVEPTISKDMSAKDIWTALMDERGVSISFSTLNAYVRNQRTARRKNAAKPSSSSA
jgi:hypothetical protein